MWSLSPSCGDKQPLYDYWGVININIFQRAMGRKKEIVIIDDKNMYDESKRTSLKRVAIESVIGMIARTVIQSEFRVKKDKKNIKNHMYYKLNVKPNKNQSSTVFWNDVIYRLMQDGECLIVKSRNDDLLVAEDYVHEEWAVKEDRFKNVYVKGLELGGTYKRSEVLFFEYGNENLSKLVDSLFCDYGEMLGRLIDYQLRKGQLRATIDVDASFAKGEEGQKRLQNFIDKAYAAIKDRSIALMPQQKGLEYKEHSRESASNSSVDEINKITDGFMNQVATAVGMPIPFLKGDMADIEKITRNYMKFCIDPIIKIIKDELNMQFVTESEYLKGDLIDVKRISYRDMFDNAVAVDKLRSSSVVDGHELRDELGLDYSNDPIHDKLIMTKNYTDAEGGYGGNGEE